MEQRAGQGKSLTKRLYELSPKPPPDVLHILRWGTTQSSWSIPALGCLGATPTPAALGRTGTVPGTERRAWVFSEALGSQGAARSGLRQEGREAGSCAAQHEEGTAFTAGAKGKALTAVQCA